MVLQTCCFREDIRLQSLKFARQPSHRLRGHTILALCNPSISYFQNIAIGKVSERPPKFSIGVWVVDYTDIIST